MIPLLLVIACRPSATPDPEVGDRGDSGADVDETGGDTGAADTAGNGDTTDTAESGAPTESGDSGPTVLDLQTTSRAKYVGDGSSPATDFYGETWMDARPLGDQDGDGIGEIAVAFSAEVTPDGYGRIYIWSGTATGTLGPDDAVATLAGAGNFGATLRTGDFDGDGVDDLLAGSPGANEFAGQASVYLGPLTGDIARADGLLDGYNTFDDPSTTASYGVGESLDAADVTGDGLDDVILGCAGCDSGDGAVIVAAGPVTGTIALETGATARIKGGDFIARRMFAGDFDGDGVGDIVYSNNNSRSTALYFGPIIGVLGPSDVDWTADDASDTVAYGVEVGDLDGDGREDIGVYTGVLYLFESVHAGAEDTASADARVEGDEFSGFAAAPGDVDGDGFDDLGYRGTGATWILPGPVAGGVIAGESGLAISDGDAFFLATGAGDLLGDGHADLVGIDPADEETGMGGGAARLLLGDTLF